MESELIDRIYECSFVPEMWPQALRDTSKMSESAGASLFVTNPEVTAWTASKNTRDIAERFVADGGYWRGPLMSAIHSSRLPELSLRPCRFDAWSSIGFWLKIIK